MEIPQEVVDAVNGPYEEKERKRYMSWDRSSRVFLRQAYRDGLASGKTIAAIDQEMMKHFNLTESKIIYARISHCDIRKQAKHKRTKHARQQKSAIPKDAKVRWAVISDEPKTRKARKKKSNTHELLLAVCIVACLLLISMLFISGKP